MAEPEPNGTGYQSKDRYSSDPLSQFSSRTGHWRSLPRKRRRMKLRKPIIHTRLPTKSPACLDPKSSVACCIFAGMSKRFSCGRMRAGYRLPVFSTSCAILLGRTVSDFHWAANQGAKRLFSGMGGDRGAPGLYRFWLAPFRSLPLNGRLVNLFPESRAVCDE